MPIVNLRHVKIRTYRVHIMRTRFDRKSIKTFGRKGAKSLMPGQNTPER